MFRRKNKQHSENDWSTGRAIPDKQDAEGSLLSIGNEAAGMFSGSPDSPSNEANNSITVSDDSFVHYAENDLNNFILKTGSGNKQKEVPAGIIIEGLENYYENDLKI